MAPTRPHYFARTQLAILLSSTAFVAAPLWAQQGGNTVAVNLLLPPAFQAAEGAPPLGDAPPNLRPPEFETIQPLPPSAQPAAPAPAPSVPVTPVPAPVQGVPTQAPTPVAPPAFTPAPAPAPEMVPAVPAASVTPVDPQVPPALSVESATKDPAPYPARKAPEAAPAEVNTARETMVTTQAESYYETAPAVQARPMGRRSSGAGRVIGQRYEVPQALSQTRVDSPLRPIPENSAPPTQGGYFPTQAESPILAGGNADYPRAKGDRGYWAYSGLWPVRSAPDNYYQRNGAFYDRLERGLRTVMPGNNALYHSPDPDFLTIDLDYGFGIFSEDIAADRVMLKLGPLYLDFLGVSASMLYTDYSGDAPLPAGVEDDGWISIIGIPIRAALRITDQIYITSSMFFYFLPGEGEVGFSTGIGSGWALGTNARLNVEWENGPWMFRLYDYFGVSNSLADFYEGWEVGEVDAVGRYRFGSEILDSTTRSESFWDPRFGGYRNDIGFEFQRPFQNEWWLLGNVIHSDYWAQADMDDHTDADQFSLMYSYMGDDWMFAPSFGYQGVTPDHFDTMSHQVFARVTGRVTEYLSMYGQVGYFWQNGEDASEDGSFTWDVGVSHDLTQYTRHSLSGGQVYTLSEQLDEYLGQYVRYTINHSVNERLRLGAYGQYQDTRRLGDGAEFQGWTLGAQAGYSLGDDTGITAGITYQNNESAKEGTTDEEIWIYYATIQRPLLARLNGNVTYQYLDQRGAKGSNVKEHLLIMGVNYVY